MKKIHIVLIFTAMLSGLTARAQENDTQKAAEEAAAAYASTPETVVKEPKPVYWTNSLTANLNFIQAMYCNWAKGGYNNYTFSAYTDGKANYEKDKFYWNNRAQLYYGFLYSAETPIIQKNTDKILLESTAGKKATNSLSYTAKFTFLSQFSNGYTYSTPSVEDPTRQDWKDARTLKSGFLSPANVTLGLGIDWVPTAWLTMNIAPLTGGFTIVKNEDLRYYNSMDRKSGYADDDTVEDADAPGYYFKSARFEFGAQLTLEAKLKVNDNFEASTYLLIFSNYLDKPQNLRVNWDTKFAWQLGKFFSLNLTTNLVYDDTVLIVNDDHPDGHRAIQFYEALQFGFSYTFSSKK